MKDILASLPTVKPWSHPEILNLAVESDRHRLRHLVDNNEVRTVADEVNIALDELYDIKHPSQIDTKSEADLAQFAQELGHNSIEEYGNWVFYPWSGELVHFPEAHDLRALRSSRNRNLITSEEQEHLSQKSIVIVGLSVGSNAVDSLVRQGIGGKYILVDNDRLEPTNLNRIASGYNQVGQHKVHALAKKISELDPYAQQVHYLEGLNEDNLDQIFEQHRPDIVIDEMDQLRMKILLRLKAKEIGLPVIMAADDGDNIVLDIERFDVDKNTELLQGRIPQNIIQAILEGKLERKDTGLAIGKYFVGPENIPLRMYQSLAELGKTLPSWPQLGGTAVLAGIILAYCARKIMLNQPINSGRFVIGPDSQLNPEVGSAEYKQQIQPYIEQLEAYTLNSMKKG